MISKSQTVCRLALIVALVVFNGFSSGVRANEVTHVVLETFQMPEVVPNATLDETEEVKGSSGTLVRDSDALHAIISTRNLPEGVYTFWWELTHPDGVVSILWAGSKVVSSNGKAVLNTTLPEGEENVPGDIFIGNGLQPGTAALVEVELWVRYHGALSDDPAIAYEQQAKPFGACTDDRNPNPRPGDYPCWNPQRAIFSSVEEEHGDDDSEEGDGDEDD